MHGDDRAEVHDGIVGALLDDDGVFDLILELLDGALVRRLFVARRVVLGVLGKIAVAARLGDALDDLRAFDLLQILELFDRLVIALLRHGKFCHFFLILT